MFTTKDMDAEYKKGRKDAKKEVIELIEQHKEGAETSSLFILNYLLNCVKEDI